MHGGDILLFSEVGHGATFIITFPREPGPVRQSTPRNESPSSATASHKQVSA
jgi:hypothetical protein